MPPEDRLGPTRSDRIRLMRFVSHRELPGERSDESSIAYTWNNLLIWLNQIYYSYYHSDHLNELWWSVRLLQRCDSIKHTIWLGKIKFKLWLISYAVWNKLAGGPIRWFFYSKFVIEIRLLIFQRIEISVQKPTCYHI